MRLRGINNYFKSIKGFFIEKCQKKIIKMKDISSNNWVDATILFADVVEFSKRDELKQKEIYEYLWLVIRDELSKFQERSDFILKSTGDGILLIVFNLRINVLEISKRLQKELKKRNVYIRQGLNCGRVSPLRDGEDAIGDPINICQRIMDCGDANHILASDHFVATKIGRRPPYENFHNLGEVEVKHREKLRIFNYFDKECGNSDLLQILFRWRKPWEDASAERIGAFRDLRSKAKNSMLVMGVGMTFFSSDLNYLNNLLERGLIVKLLMINPDIISSTPNDKSSYFIKSKLFEDYFERQGYSTDVRTSLNRLTDFIEKRKELKTREKGKVILKKYSYFIPLNVTIIDEKTEKGQILIEWCLPFSDWRLNSFLSSQQHKEFFEIINNSIERLWKGSEMVIADDCE